MRGIIPLNRGVITWIEIHDGDFRTTVYEPTGEQITEICHANDLPVTGVNKMISEAARNGAHGILINVPECKKGLLEESIVHLYYLKYDAHAHPICKDVEREEWVTFDHTAMGKICPDCQDKLGRKIG